MSSINYRNRRILLMICGLIFFSYLIVMSNLQQDSSMGDTTRGQTNHSGVSALSELVKLAVKGRAPKTGYTRERFGQGWSRIGKCDTRNLILYRDLAETSVNDNCLVLDGVLSDPYTGKVINFKRSNGSSIQIDHVVALSDAWQKGAQVLTAQRRQELANDPLELLAVSGIENQNKGDSDAASWLPPNKSFRCEYVARQIAVKSKYQLWVTTAERDAIKRVLEKCPDQLLPLP